MNQFADTIMVEPTKAARPPALTITIGPPIDLTPDQVEHVKQHVTANKEGIRASLKPRQIAAGAAQTRLETQVEHAWQSGFREGFTEGRVGDRLRTWLWGAATGVLAGATLALAWPLVG